MRPRLPDPGDGCPGPPGSLPVFALSKLAKGEAAATHNSWKKMATAWEASSIHHKAKGEFFGSRPRPPLGRRRLQR